MCDEFRTEEKSGRSIRQERSGPENSDKMDKMDKEDKVDLMSQKIRKKQLRRISTEGCRILGSGRSSVVYRLDQETIVKKYDPRVPSEMILQEKENSRKAFVAGIRTAIPFDLVWVDDSYGVVFELIAPADTVGNVITSHRERFPELTGKFTELLKQTHRTRTKEWEDFSSSRDKWLEWAEGMKPYYEAEELRFLEQMIRGIPERDTLVHNDFHENNVLVLRDEMILIDMADIGYGHPIYDLAGVAFRAHVSTIPGRNANHGLSADDMQLFRDMVFREYFDTEDREELEEIREMCEAFGLVRSAIFPMKHKQIPEELREIHIHDVRQRLFPWKDWALRQLEKLDRFFSENCETERN